MLHLNHLNQNSAKAPVQNLTKTMTNRTRRIIWGGVRYDEKYTAQRDLLGVEMRVISFMRCWFRILMNANLAFYSLA